MFCVASVLFILNRGITELFSSFHTVYLTYCILTLSLSQWARELLPYLLLNNKITWDKM